MTLSGVTQKSRGVSAHCSAPVTGNETDRFPTEVFEEWNLKGTGPLATNGIEAGVKIRP